MGLEPAELDALIAVLGIDEGPLGLDDLVRRVVRLSLDQEADLRAYAPGASYRPGEQIWFEGERAVVVAIRHCESPRQGKFDIIELRTSDGAVRRATAAVAGARQVAPSPNVSEVMVAQRLQAWSPELRDALRVHPRVAPLLEDLSSPPEGQTASCHLSSSLFLARYVDAALPQLYDGGGTEADLRMVFAEIAELWRALRVMPLPQDAPTTWRCFTAPVLAALGWSAEPLPAREGFRLTPHPASQYAAAAQLGAGSPAEMPSLALILPLPWEDPLGLDPDTTAMRSPATRLVGELFKGDAAWGILTNGRRWRLYRKAWGDADIGSTVAQFHEVDVADFFDLSSDGEVRPAQWAAFRCWHAVFGAASFVPDAAGSVWTTDLKSRTAAYAREVVQRLRTRLLSTVLPEVAGGFIAFRFHERDRRPACAGDLLEIRRASLRLIYRLLFVLHAEHHRLLPLDDADYRGQSLTTLLKQANADQEEGRPLSRSTRSTPRYEALLALFHRLEYGGPALTLPGCGGGLFSPVDVDGSFIERHRLSDRVVVRMLVALGELDGLPIDYRVLTVRHLSAVGEGLLAHKLRVVEPSVGQVALVDDEDRAQATSSVPVPDYIGLSSIERALADSLARRARSFESAMDRVAALRREFGSPEPDKAREPATLATAERHAFEALLGISVVDPAMGAGTFLVGSVDILTDGMMAVMAAYHTARPGVPWFWNPVMQAISQMRAALVAESARRGILLNPELLSDDRILARLIVQYAVYGVDIDPIAVALSRASVGMRALLPGAPFLPLGKHLVEGNSLLSPRFSDVAGAAPVEGMDGAEGATLKETVTEGGFGCWDTQFPEVFLASGQAENERPGFDVVLGNPPLTPLGLASPAVDGADFQALAQRLLRQPHGRVAFVMTRSAERG